MTSAEWPVVNDDHPTDRRYPDRQDRATRMPTVPTPWIDHKATTVNPARRRDPDSQGRR